MTRISMIHPVLTDGGLNQSEGIGFGILASLRERIRKRFGASRFVDTQAINR
jgi:hypothetical protein